MPWRRMTVADLDDVSTIAATVHVAYPEDPCVFAERLDLYPAGCRVAMNAHGLAGYLFSHPWHFKDPPALNSLLGKLPETPSTFYIHDLALLPAARRTGQAQDIVAEILGQARTAGIANCSLIAVNRSAGFWARMGFVVVDDPALDAKLRSYDAEASFMVHRFR